MHSGGDEKCSCDRVPTKDFDKRQWRSYKRDAEPFVETEKLDIECSIGERLLSRLTGTAKTFAETTEPNNIRPVTGAN